MFAILVSFVVLGLWHEFSLRYLVFGILHGLGVILSVLMLAPLQDKINEKCRSPVVEGVVNWTSRGIVIMFVSLVSSIAVIDQKDYVFIFIRVLGLGL